MRDTERQSGRDTGRGRSRLPVGSLMWDSILGLQDHALGWRQVLNCWAIQASLGNHSWWPLGIICDMKSGRPYKILFSPKEGVIKSNYKKVNKNKCRNINCCWENHCESWCIRLSLVFIQFFHTDLFGMEDWQLNICWSLKGNISPTIFGVSLEK